MYYICLSFSTLFPSRSENWAPSPCLIVHWTATGWVKHMRPSFPNRSEYNFTKMDKLTMRICMEVSRLLVLSVSLFPHGSQSLHWAQIYWIYFVNGLPQQHCHTLDLPYTAPVNVNNYKSITVLSEKIASTWKKSYLGGHVWERTRIIYNI